MTEAPPSFRVEAPIDEVATWDLEVGWLDEISKLENDLVWSCADYVAHLPGVDNVEYESGERIFVWGPVAASDLTASVSSWLVRNRGSGSLPAG